LSPGPRAVPSRPVQSVLELQSEDAREPEPRWEAEDRIIDRWVKASTRTKAPKGAALDTIREAVEHHIEIHSAEDVETTIDYMATNLWWRGKEKPDQTKDLYSSKPMAWLKWKSAESELKFDGFVEEAKAWKAAGRSVGPPPKPGTREAYPAADELAGYGAIVRLEGEYDSEPRPTSCACGQQIPQEWAPVLGWYRFERCCA
jgi:hypothetical protein